MTVNNFLVPIISPTIATSKDGRSQFKPKFAKQNNLEFSGYSYEEFILDEISVIGYDNYLTQIQIQVQLK